MSEESNKQVDKDEILRMTANIVSAYVSNNVLGTAQISDVIGETYRSLVGLNNVDDSVAIEPQKPAVNPKKSIFPDYIICLEDGKKLKMLKRYLRTNYNMSPEEYRAKWRLPSDYPMVAPDYAAQRSEFAKKIGLGKGSGRVA